MMKQLLMLFLLGWYLKQVYGHQSSQAGYDPNNKYVPATREVPRDKFPSPKTYTPGYQAQDERTMPYNYMAPGIIMAKDESMNVMPNTVQSTTPTATPARNKNIGSTEEENARIKENSTNSYKKDDPYFSEEHESNKSLNKDENYTQVSEDNISRNEVHSHTSERYTTDESMNVMPNTVQSTTPTATPARNKNIGSTEEENARIKENSTNSYKKDDPYFLEEHESNKSLNKDENYTQVSEDNISRNEAHSHTSERYTTEEHLVTPSSLPTISDSEGYAEPHDHIYGLIPDSRRDDHRMTRRNDLCSSCLCDPQKKNVLCKHEHIYDGESHHLNIKREYIPTNAISLHIMDFEKVTITNGTFSSEDLELRKIIFENIGMLEIYKESLYFNSKAKDNRKVEVIFLRCNIKEIPLETFTQYSTSEDQRNAIYLEKTRSLTLHIERCNITTIRSYAFFQARLLNFKMLRTKVDIMEENCIHLDIYKEWIVKYCHLPKLAQQTISLRTQMIVMFSHNFMGGLENRSLDILSSNQVLFENNYISYLGSEALLGIRPHENAHGANIVLLNNTVVNAEERAFVTSNRYLSHGRQILDNMFDIACNCSIKLTFQHLLGISNNSDHYDQAVIENFQCQRFADLALYTNIENYYNENCTPLPIPIIASAAVVITVIIITIIVCIVCTQRTKKAKEEANYLGECCYSQSFSTLHSNPGPPTTPLDQSNFSECGNYLQPWIMAVPEVKTYQESEVDVQYEHTEPMKVNFRERYIPEPLSDFQRKAKVRASYPFN